MKNDFEGITELSCKMLCDIRIAHLGLLALLCVRKPSKPARARWTARQLQSSLGSSRKILSSTDLPRNSRRHVMLSNVGRLRNELNLQRLRLLHRLLLLFGGFLALLKFANDAYTI